MVLLDYIANRGPAAAARGQLEPAALVADARRGGARRRRRRLPADRRRRRSSTTTRRSCAPAIPAIDLIDFSYRYADTVARHGRQALRAQPRRGRRVDRRADARAPRELTRRRAAGARLVHSGAMAAPFPEKLLLAAPRGYCAGVDRAVQTVERALELHGAPVYVRKEIVHNKHVVEQLRARGAVFVEELDDSIPEGAVTVFSAHGVSPAVHADAAEPRPADDRRDLPARHEGPPRGAEVRRRGLHDRPHRPLGPRGGRGHDGRGARATSSSSRPRPTSTRSRSRTPTKIAYISQTTLSVDETRAIINRLRERFPKHHRAAHGRHLLRHDEPPGGGQADGAAVRPRARHRLAELVELEPARRGRPRPRRRVVPDRQRGRRSRRSGSTACASSASPPARARPRSSSSASSTSSATRGTTDVEEFQVVQEDVRFMLPKTIRQALGGAVGVRRAAAACAVAVLGLAVVPVARARRPATPCGWRTPGRSRSSTSRA